MESLLFAAFATLAVIDVAACVVTFIWLIVLGQWWAIGYGFAAIPATVVLIFLARPSQWIRLPDMSLIDARQSALAYMCHLASRLLDAAVAAGWFGGVLFVFSRTTTNFSFWALVVWGYGLALAAWNYRSRSVEKNDTGDLGGQVFQLSVNAAYLTCAVLIVGFALRPPLLLMQIFAGVTFTGAIAASVIGFLQQKKRAAMGTVYSQRP